MIGKLPELFMFRDPFNAKLLFEYCLLMILMTSPKKDFKEDRKFRNPSSAVAIL